MKGIMIVKVTPSTRKDKELMIEINDKTIHIGSQGMDDFTSHQHEKRKERYIARHRVSENWNESGLHTAGFRAKYVVGTNQR